MSTATHSYFDWQISTLMLAYDVVAPLDRDDVEAQSRRQQDVELELHRLVHAVLPQRYRDNPQAEFPPDIVMELTRATLRRAAEIVGLI